MSLFLNFLPVKCFGQVVSGCELEFTFDPIDPNEPGAPVAEPGDGLFEPGGGGIPFAPTEEPVPIFEPGTPNAPKPEPIFAPGTPGAPGGNFPGEPNSGSGTLVPPGGRKRASSGILLMPLYRLSFSIPKTARRLLQEERILPKESTGTQQVYPTLDDFSVLEFVTSMHIYIHLTKVIEDINEESNDNYLSIAAVITEVGATHLETTLKTKELKVNLNTTLVFDDESVTPSEAMIQYLWKTVETFFQDKKMLAEFAKKLQIEAASHNNEVHDFFTEASEITWAPLDNGSGDLVYIESPKHSPNSNEGIPVPRKQSTGWVASIVTVVLVLATLIVALIFVRRQRHKIDESWLENQCGSENDKGSYDGDTVVFSDSKPENCTASDRLVPVEHIDLTEPDTTSSKRSSQSLFWSVDEFVNGEDEETCQAGSSGNSCDFQDREPHGSPLPSYLESLENADSRNFDSDGDSPPKYEYSLRTTELQKERDVNFEDNDNPDSQASSFEQLQQELAEANLEQANLEHEEVFEITKESECERPVVHQSDLMMKSESGREVREKTEQQKHNLFRWWNF